MMDGDARSEPVATPTARAAGTALPATSTHVQAADRRVLTALCLGSFIATLTVIAPAPFFPAMARDLDVSVPLLGQIATAMLLLAALLGLVIGPLADRYGHRRLIVLGMVAATVCLLVLGLAPTFWILLLGSLAGGLAEAAVPGQSLAVAGTHFSGPASRRAISWTIAALAGSGIIGVPVLTAIGSASNWRVAFMVAGLVALSTTWLVAAWLPRTVPVAREALHVRTFFSTYGLLLRAGGTRRLYAASALRAVGWYGVLTYLGAYLADELGLDTGQIGLAYMLGGTGYFLGSLVAGGPLARVPPLQLLILGNLVLATLTGILFAAVTGSAGTVAILSVLCFAAAFGWIGITALLTAETPVGAGVTMALNGSLLNVGAAGGGAIGGLLLALAGYDALAYGLPLFSLASALLVWRRLP